MLFGTAKGFDCQVKHDGEHAMKWLSCGYERLQIVMLEQHLDFCVASLTEEKH